MSATLGQLIVCAAAEAMADGPGAVTMDVKRAINPKLIATVRLLIDMIFHLRMKKTRTNDAELGLSALLFSLIGRAFIKCEDFAF